MITGSSTRELSLVEQKRLQWQKEREEIERMGSERFSHSQTKYERTSIKTYFSNVDLSMNSTQFQEPVVGRNFQPFPAAPQNTNFNGYGYNPNPPPPPHSRGMRSPSLPPIPREKFYNYPNSQTLIINPGHTMDTGYHSETSPMNNDGPVQVWTNDDDGRGSNKTVTLRSRANNNGRPDIGGGGRTHFPENHQMTPDIKPLGTPNSLSSGQTFSTMSQSVPGSEHQLGVPQRRKWNDTPQSYLEPMTRSLDSRSSQNVPYWLEKGLHEMRDSEDESVRSHIRGQNVPLDPSVVAERASRRRKAMELQSAIKEQLMEQERMKKWEKEKRLQEELLAEEKLRQQVEAERQRLDYENRVREEKVENERRKAEFMRLAVEKAELEAKLEKERRKRHTKVVQEDLISRIDTPMNDHRSPSVTARDTISETQVVLERPNVTPQTSSPQPPQQLPPSHEIVNKSSDIDGIALVLQSISPMVPLTNLGQAQPDLLGLNNSVNNLQFALLLAQQQQQLNIQARQLNTISSASSILSNGEGTSPNTVREGIKPAANQSKTSESNREEGSEERECVYCCRIHGGHGEKIPVERLQEEKKEMKEEKSPESPKITVNHHQKTPTPENEDIPEEITDALDVPKIPNDGTFIKDDTITDTEISTQTDGELSGNEVVTWDRPRMLTPRKYRVSSASSKSLVSVAEIGVQTDLLLLENCNICTHKQLVLKEISQVTTSVTQTSCRKNELSPLRRSVGEPLKDDQGLTMTTITTTTTIRAKANERSSRHSNKKEPRPKWGVNQPAFQYVKASDRDPFCLRRRKKGQLKSFSVDNEEEEEGAINYGKKADSGVSSNNGSLHSMDLYEDTDKEVEGLSRRRNICTEILPITTDGNGKVFVNFREARVVQKDELSAGGNIALQAGREKIMEKRLEDLPFIPSVFRTDRKLTKSASDSNYFPSTTSVTAPSLVSKGDKEEINQLRRNEL